MAYFRNNTVNLLNLHYGIHSLALSGGGAFFAVFLLKSGVPPPAVLAAIAAILIGRFAIRPRVLVLAPSLGDTEHRGHQIGAREAIAAVVGIIGPLAAGWALTTLGPRVAFDATAVVLVLAALPIIWTPNVKVAWTAPGALKAAVPGVLLFAADGWCAAPYYFLWQIALFVSLGESYSAYAGAMALAAVVGALSGMALGRLIDLGHGTRAVWIALATLAGESAVRAA